MKGWTVMNKEIVYLLEKEGKNRQIMGFSPDGLIK